MTTPRDAIGLSERLREYNLDWLTRASSAQEVNEAIAAIDSLSARVKELEGQVYVPGSWHCPKCKFTLLQSNLNAQDGTVTARDTPGDKCPNCNGPLWRCTWKNDAFEMQERAVEQMERAKAAESRAIRAEQQRDTLSRVMEDTASELGCASDNEAILEAIDRLKQERDEALERLKPLARDFEMNDCDDRADDDAMEVSIKDLRAASDCVRRLAVGRPDTNPDEG